MPETAESGYAHLAGHRFPGGTYTLPEHVSWLWADAIGAAPDAAVAHPSLAYFVAIRSSGVAITDVFELMGADADSGVLMGEVDMEFDGTLRPGATYEGEGEIAAIERKRGARAGAFDRLQLRFSVREQGSGAPVLRCGAAWIFPRPEA
jgi:hypothetical protein